MEFKNKRVMVVGMAASGISAAKLLLKLGAKVYLYDAKPASSFDLTGLSDKCVLRFEADPKSVVDECDILVMSPGVPVRIPFVDYAKSENKPVIAEIELGFLTSEADFVTISGTNGKTTTTALTGEIFKNAGFTLEEFGGNSLALKEVPYFLGKLDAKGLFLNILDNIKELGSGKTSEVKYNKIATMACKAAVKGHDLLSEQEMIKLVEELRYINDPFHCPHGRPTIIKFTNYDLEKKFRRIV